jgi:hypothetical protein
MPKRKLGCPGIIEIEAEPVKIEELLPDSKLKEQLIGIYYKLLSKYPEMSSFVNNNTGHINCGAVEQGFNPETGVLVDEDHVRSLYFIRDNYAIAAKGTGELEWRIRKSSRLAEKTRIPIIKNNDFSEEIPTRRCWGGEKRQFASLQFERALFFHWIMERYAQKASTLVPLSFKEIKELPIVSREGKLEMIPLSDYSFKISGIYEEAEELDTLKTIFHKRIIKNAVTTPPKREMRGLGIFYYLALAPHKRLPLLEHSKNATEAQSPIAGGAETPLEYATDDTLLFNPHKLVFRESHCNTYGVPFKKSDLSDKEIYAVVMNFTQNLCSLVAIAHKEDTFFGETFRTKGIKRQFSSLDPGNVTVKGEVLDLDSVRSTYLGDKVKGLKLRESDIENTIKCLGIFSAITDDKFLDESLDMFRKIYLKYNPDYSGPLNRIISV